MFNLSGKVALVAGGTGYLGLPVSLALARQGAAVPVADRNPGRVAAAAAEVRNSVAPGAFTHSRPEFPADEAYLCRQTAKTMLGRIGRREETAGAVIFLAAEAASYITGSVLPIDGGWTAW